MSIQVETGASNSDNPKLLFENIFESGTVTFSSQAADGQGLNAIEDSTFDFWTPTALNGVMQVDYGSAVAVDCIGIAAHDAGTNGSTIAVQSSADGTTWSASRITFEPLTDETLMGIFPEVSARYWRVLISDVVCSLGVVKLGKAISIPNGVISGHIGISHSKRVDLLTNISTGGQYLRTRVKRIGADASINFGLLETDFVENTMATFESHYNSGRTFFYAGAPVSFPNDYGYCWRSGSEMRPGYQEGGTLMDVELDVSVYVE
jgi:hypothetical protein